MDNVDQYIVQFPLQVQEILNQIRGIILDAHPDIVEFISYQMPAYKLNGKPLVYFAGYSHHIGFYATPSGHQQFATELAEYVHGKGSVQFSLDKPIPFHLIKQMIDFRVSENS